MTARTRIAATLTAALLTAGVALAATAAADETTAPSLDEILYQGPVNELLMPVGDVLDVVDPAGVDEREGENESLSAPVGEDNVAEIPTDEPPANNKRPGKR